MAFTGILPTFNKGENGKNYRPIYNNNDIAGLKRGSKRYATYILRIPYFFPYNKD